MSEKIKIYLPAIIKSTLQNDAELFEFKKQNGDVNFNAFLKTVLVNYFEHYEEKQKKAYEAIESIVRSTGLSPSVAQNLSNEIQELLSAQNDSRENTEAVTLTVSRDAAATINIITRKCLRHLGLSEYIRRLLLSYLSMPRNQRELIVFGEQYEDLLLAIKQKRLVSFSTTNQAVGKAYTAFPYCIIASKQEQFNYLICYDVNNPVVRSFRLSRLHSIFVEKDSITLDREIIKLLETTASRGPQFSFQDAQMTCVVLTEEGKRKLQMIYTNRPEVDHIDGDRFYFFWPLIQIKEYFKRFGGDAIIVDPENAYNDMKAFYSDALKTYSAIRSETINTGK